MPYPTFILFKEDSNVESVEVAGSFNSWNKVKMEKVYDNEWSLKLELPPGQYYYKFFVDNKWTHNKEKPTIPNIEGVLHNIITVEEKGDLEAEVRDALLKKMKKLDELKKNLPAGWEELHDPNGKAYYFNSNTNTNQWEHPGGVEGDEDAIPDGIAALQSSIKIGNEDDCKFLIQSGEDINWTNGIILRPLALSIAYGRENICCMLIEAGADVNARDGEGVTPHGEGVTPHGEGKTPLIHAIFRDNQNICKMLIEAGADVELTDRKGNRPLEKAVDLDRKNILKMLMEAGANIETSDCPGGHLLFAAIKKATDDGPIDIVKMIIEKRPDIVKMSIEERPDLDFLREATSNGHTEICKLLIEAGADPLKDDGNPYFASPLYISVQTGRTDIAKMFLEKLPNMNADNHEQKIPLTAATEERHAEICKSLVNALRVAIRNEHTEMCELLIEAGAVAKPNDEEVRKAFYDALKEGLTDIAKMIIEKTPNIDVNDYERSTPLIVAIEKDNVEIVKLLVEAGADLNKQADGTDHFEEIPLILAARHGKVQICKLLVEAGADMDKKNEDGCTALIEASQEGHEDVCDILLAAGAKPIKESLK